MLRTVFLYALLIPLLIAGCGQPIITMPLKTPALESPAPSLTSTPTFAFTPVLPVVVDEWTIKMTHSGGIMGLMRSIIISSDGNYTVHDERANKTVSGELSGNELATLKEIVSILNNAAVQRPGPSGCADCFIYDLEIQGSGKNIVFHLDDISLSESGMKSVIMYLRDLIDTALK